jgi:hypothetical protein
VRDILIGRNCPTFFPNKEEKPYAKDELWTQAPPQKMVIPSLSYVCDYLFCARPQ